MGEVYRARDSKLKRVVAIKILPDAFARDTERITRFQREAEVLASLNHPNIAGIYDLEHVNDSRFLVLELVEGDTLADRIARGPIPVDEAIAIAKQMAEALEAAHDKGIIHRDLKPANVKLTADGNVKVLDFGLAKMHEDESSPILSNSPTLMSATQPGMVLGTAAYMSPEQVRGKTADRTSDVWAFGCVFYEMLTGRQVFQGETAGEIFAAVLKEEPAWEKLPAQTSRDIRRLLRRCLQKDRKLRTQHLGDARIEIEESLSEPEAASPVAVQRSKTRQAIIFVSALALLMLIAGVFTVRNLRQTHTDPEARLEINTPPLTGDDAQSLAISPDGQKIAFVGISGGRPALWLRSLDSGSARVLSGTEGASYPFWSPDSRSIAFFADQKLKRIDVDGGAPQNLANSGSFSPGTWNRDGVILYSPLPGRPILRVSASGGGTTPVTRIEERGQTGGHSAPSFLPDGNHFLYTVGAGESSGVYIGQLHGPDTKRIINDAVLPTYVSTGHLVFARRGALLAQKFDPRLLESIGDPFQVAEHVMDFSRAGAAENGTIVYRTAAGSRQRQFRWFDRLGKDLGAAGDPADLYLGMPSISPDGRTLAFSTDVGGNDDVWLLDLMRGVASRFTSAPGNDVFPVWSPDATRIVFSSTRIKGAHDIYQKTVLGAAAEDLLLATSEDKVVTDWSPDGGYILYFTYDSKTQHNIWALPVTGERKPVPVVQTEFEERSGQFSPDGHWIAYQSNESGKFEIYLQPFPGPGPKLRISTSGGAEVRWRRDGKELFYVALDGQLMAVPIRLPGAGSTVQAGAPMPLFLTHMPRAVDHLDGQQYVVSPDGQRFLINTIPIEQSTPPIGVILNWKPKQ